MATGPTLSEMADAVAGLTATLGNQLRSLEHLSYSYGLMPGRDRDLAGLRIAVARGEAAAQSLRALVPYEAEFKSWFAGRIADRVERAAATGSPV